MKQVNFLVLIPIVVLLSKCSCVTAVYMQCNKNGFTCTNSTVMDIIKMDVKYQCKYHDVTINISKFLETLNIRRLTIENCLLLTVDFSYSATCASVEELHVENIATLRFAPTRKSSYPQSIIFKNIGKIETISNRTFSQIVRAESTCPDNIPNLETLVFENLVIGTIESQAFGNLTDMKFFRWENVTVERAKEEALQIFCQDNSSFHILNSVIKVLETSAFQVVAERMFISSNKFTEISSRAFAFTLQYFDFSYNSVGKTQEEAFGILANEVSIMGNSFEYLHSDTFKNIGPRFVYHSAQPPSYSFCHNFIKHADNGGLLPDTIAYSKTTDAAVRFVNNSFYCFCEELNWMKIEVKEVRQNVVNPKHNNICEAPCILPLVVMEQLILSKRLCYNTTTINLNDVCQIYNEHKEEFYFSSANIENVSQINLVCLILGFVIFNSLLY